MVMMRRRRYERGARPHTRAARAHAPPYLYLSFSLRTDQDEAQTLDELSKDKAEATRTPEPLRRLEHSMSLLTSHPAFRALSLEQLGGILEMLPAERLIDGPVRSVTIDGIDPSKASYSYESSTLSTQPTDRAAVKVRVNYKRIVVKSSLPPEPTVLPSASTLAGGNPPFQTPGAATAREPGAAAPAASDPQSAPPGDAAGGSGSAPPGVAAPPAVDASPPVPPGAPTISDTSPAAKTHRPIHTHTLEVNYFSDGEQAEGTVATLWTGSITLLHPSDPSKSIELALQNEGEEDKKADEGERAIFRSSDSAKTRALELPDDEGFNTFGVCRRRRGRPLLSPPLSPCYTRSRAPHLSPNHPTQPPRTSRLPTCASTSAAWPLPSACSSSPPGPPTMATALP